MAAKAPFSEQARLGSRLHVREFHAYCVIFTQQLKGVRTSVGLHF